MQSAKRYESKRMKVEGTGIRSHDIAECRSSSETLIFTDFNLVGPQIVENALPNKNYMLRKVGTEKK